MKTTKKKLTLEKLRIAKINDLSNVQGGFIKIKKVDAFIPQNNSEFGTCIGRDDKRNSVAQARCKSADCILQF